MTIRPFSEGITLLGAEMLTWSDLRGEVGGFGGRLAPHLLVGFGGTRGRVLVAGPTTADVVAGLAEDFAETHVLIRSWLDAQELRAALSDDVAINCGPLDRLPVPDGGYDAVVAVAGTDRLHSAEEPTPAWQEVVAHLARLLGEHGELYLAVGNSVGVDRLVALDPVNRQHDAAWPQGRAAAAKPRDVGEVLAHLAAEHGLTTVDTWACHGSRTAPRAAAPASVLDALRTDPVVLRAVAAAYPSSAQGCLRDPGPAAADLVASGLGAATAPLSVLHLRRGGNADGAGEGGRMLLAQEENLGSEQPVVMGLERLGGRWRRALLTPRTAYDVAPGVTREPARLEGDLPDGESVAARLFDLLGQHDVSSAGELMRLMRDWLGEEPDAPVDPRRVPVQLDRLLVDADGLVPLDDSVASANPAERDTVLVRAVLCFAYWLLASGGRHPWSDAATPRTLTRSLVAAAEVEVTPGRYDAAVALDRSLRAPGTDVPDFEASLGGEQAIGAMSYAALVELVESLAVRAATQDAHVVWLLDALQKRQRRLRRTRGNMQLLENSREYRVGRRILWIRDLRRRWRAKREEKVRPAGHWRAAPEPEPAEDRWLEVESDLVPPGYQPHDDVVIVPPGDETEQPEQH